MGYLIPIEMKDFMKKCLNCGKDYDPTKQELPFFGLGPECVKKIYTGELNYEILKRQKDVTFGMSFDELKSQLPKDMQDYFDTVLTSQEFKTLRDPVLGVNLEYINDFLISGSINSNNQFFGVLRYNIDYIDERLENSEDLSDKEKNFMLSLRGYYAKIIANFTINNSTYHCNLFDTNTDNIQFKIPHFIYENYVGDYKADKTLKDYDIAAFDQSARYAYNLARIGLAGNGIESGVKGLLVQSVFDSIIQPKESNNDFFQIFSYVNAETDQDRKVVFPDQAILRDVILTSKFLNTKAGADYVELKRKVFPFVKQHIGEDATASYKCGLNFMKRFFGGFIVPEDRFPACAEDFRYLVSKKVTNSALRFHPSISFPGRVMNSAPSIHLKKEFSSNFYDKVKRGLIFSFDSSDVNVDARSQRIALNEFALTISGKQKMKQDSLAPLVLCVDGTVNGHFANVIRVKNGVIDKIMAAKSPGLMNFTDSLTGSIKAHAALKSTFWKDANFYSDTLKNKYEYFIATSAYDLNGVPAKVSYHFSLKSGKKEDVFDTCGLKIGKKDLLIGNLTHVWTWNSTPRHHYRVNEYTGTDASCYKLGQEDLRKDKDVKLKVSDSEKQMLKSSALIGAAIKRNLKHQVEEAVIEDAASGRFGLSGSVMMIQANNLLDKMSPHSQEFSLLKDIEVSAFGASSAGYNFDPYSILSEGNIVGEKISPNPYFSEVPEDNRDPFDVIKTYFS